MSLQWNRNVEESKLGEYSVRIVENGLQNLLFTVIKTSSSIIARKLGLKMLEHPDAPLVQIAAMNPIELWKKDVM